MRFGLLLTAGISAMLFSTLAEAHTLRIECKKTTGAEVVCRGLFSDGEVARGITVQLIDENDKVLATAKTNAEGKYTFKAPGPEFNVVIQASKAEVTSISSEDIW